MLCPTCKKQLSDSIISNALVYHCQNCLGLWFPENELACAKDNRDRNLRWLDIDLWKDKEKLAISRSNQFCPACRLPLYSVEYGDSKVVVDVCNVCRGIWLDRGEFKKIINWLKEKADYEVLNNYLKNLSEETFEIFVGPEGLRNEILDFLTIVKLFSYKFSVQHPQITRIIASLPK